jgi:hypothetical protein
MLIVAKTVLLLYPRGAQRKVDHGGQRLFNPLDRQKSTPYLIAMI